MAVYLVTSKKDPKNRHMVETRTKNGAINHIAAQEFDAKPISTVEALVLSKEGVDLQTAAEEKKAEKSAGKPAAPAGQAAKG